MKQISINWVHFQKVDAREQAIKALAIAKEQEKNKPSTKLLKLFAYTAYILMLLSAIFGMDLINWIF